MNIEKYIYGTISPYGTRKITLFSWKEFANDWLGYNIKLKESGVYLFGNFYIGASKHISKRLFNHCKMALNNLHDNDEFSEKFNEYIKAGIKIPFKIISPNIEDENHFINIYSETIVNKRPKRIMALKKYYKNHN